MSIFLLFFQEVRFPLESQADALNAGGKQPNNHSKLQGERSALVLFYSPTEYRREEWTTHSNAGAGGELHHATLESGAEATEAGVAHRLLLPVRRAHAVKRVLGSLGPSGVAVGAKNGGARTGVLL